MKRCARCQATIISSELVMRARDLVFHVHCFSCAVCNSPLTKGDHFGMRDGAVLCRLHFEMPMTEPMPPGMFPPGMHHYPPPFPSPEFHHQIPPATPVESVGKVPFFNGAPTTPRQKGRPRKRKPKDLEGMTASLDLNSDYLDMSFGRSPGTPGMHGSNQRTKRMRTSFKHHQLRTMKSYFAINHNPDAKDLKQLSQKTGLPKRVLQRNESRIHSGSTVWCCSERLCQFFGFFDGSSGDRSGPNVVLLKFFPSVPPTNHLVVVRLVEISKGLGLNENSQDKQPQRTERF
ncbi:hypothetical protein GEV33_008456 [Tenebrio molitor]|uniref:LIM zinc-binding domain-containing protein n=1 Tax=Tenebrio molitor TaxID=7067 RepID=A0A8J6HGR0_TENMO|nr:hypothetical protein GEV33_008456 [Tenebrio molitor]